VFDKNHQQTWGAQLHLRPRPGKDGGLGGAKGAYAWVFALANSDVEYREMVAAAMEALGLFIVEIENLGHYQSSEDGDDPSSRCINSLTSEWPVQYHNFHTYNDED
jgi:hypothetical protein